MASLRKLEDNEHYRISDLKKGERVSCPDGLTEFEVLDGDAIKVIVKNGRIVSKL